MSGEEGGGVEAAAEGAGRPQHARSFKLRFASQREPGRSYVSAVKPLGLPATVTGKFYAGSQAGAADEARLQAALRRIQHMFEAGPRERLPEPRTASHEYGWWRGGAAGAGRGSHHIRDSAWLKERMRVLAADARLRRP